MSDGTLFFGVIMVLHMVDYKIVVFLLEEFDKGKRIVVVNAGPRKGWNTDTLILDHLRRRTD